MLLPWLSVCLCVVAKVVAAGECSVPTRLRGTDLIADEHEGNETTSQHFNRTISSSVTTIGASSTSGPLSATGVGDYVASGVGLRLSDTGTTSTPVFGSSSSASLSPPRPSTSLSTHAVSAGLSSAAVGNATSSALVTYSGDCLHQWNQYWSISAALASTVGVITSVASYMTTVTSYSIDLDFSHETPESTYVETVTSQDKAGGLVLSQTVYTSTVTFSGPSQTTESTSIWTTSVTRTNEFGTTWSYYSMTTPPCTLPSIVPACQSSWDEYESYQKTFSNSAPSCCNTEYETTCTPDASCTSAYKSWSSAFSSYESKQSSPAPLCPLASVNTEICSSLISSYYLGYWYQDPRSYGYKITTLGNGSTSQYWPASTTFAPGCSLGCQTCRITGSRVKLLYWPVETGLAQNGSVATQANGNVTANGPVTAMYSGATLTSPTVYISFDTLYASDSCSGVGHRYSDTILAVNASTDLSSLYGIGYKTALPTGTASFNFTDLIPPVPDSIFNSQPRCAESFLSAELNGVSTATLKCARDTPYEPLLVLPTGLRSLDPAWASCDGAIQGIYDPPQALHPEASVQGPVAPTITNAVTSTQPPATPASIIQPSTPKATQAPTTNPTPVAPSSAHIESTYKPVDPSDSYSPSIPVVDPSLSSNKPDPATSAQSSAGTVDGTPTVPTSRESNDGSSIAHNPGSSPSGAVVASEVVSMLAESTSEHPSATDPGGVLASLLAGGTSARASDPSDHASTTGVSTGSYEPASQDPALSSYAAKPSAISTQPARPSAVATVAGHTIDADPSVSNAVVINGATLSAGDPGTVIGSTLVTVLPGGLLGVGNSAYQIPTASAVQQSGPSFEAQVSVNGHTLTAHPVAGSSGAMVIGQSTLSVGGPALSTDGATLSAVSDGIVVLSSGTTRTVALTADRRNIVNEAEVTLGTAVLTASQALSDPSHAIVDGITLSVGGSALVTQGQTVSLGPSGVLSENGTPKPWRTDVVSASGVSSTGPAIFEAVVTTDGVTFTVLQAGSAMILEDATSTATIAQGSAATFDGLTISAATDGHNVIINGASTMLVTMSQPASAQPASTGSGSTETSSAVLGTQVPTSTSDPEGAATSSQSDAQARWPPQPVATVLLLALAMIMLMVP